MALRVESDNQIHDFYIGDRVNCLILSTVLRSEEVISVEASSQELSVIQESFTNIPMSTNPVNRWTGETAKFIIDNLPYDVFPTGASK